MPRLSLYLLGTFQAQLDGKPLAGFATNKVRALLAYLTVEPRPHTRVRLAGLLWPEWPESAARTYLRQALANLRVTFTDQDAPSPFLLTSRQFIQFNPASDYWLDVAELAESLSGLPALDVQRTRADMATRLERAVALHRGDFLEGFFLDGCSAYQEWQLLTRERIRRQALEALGFLVQWQEARGDTVQAQRHARQRVELEPLLEEANCQLMRLLALNGEPGVALAHYERFLRLLAEELGAAPAAATTEIYRQIKANQFTNAAVGQPVVTGSGSHAPLDASAVLPPFLAMAAPIQSPALCVAREQELAQLTAHLDKALAGQGQVVFVIGEAGQGKTVMLQEFARRAERAYPNLLVAGGRGRSYQGMGEPYLPFREVMAQLTGALEAQWAAGAITREQARRLWTNVPQVVEALLLHGPDLIDTLVAGGALAARLSAFPASAAWRAQLASAIRRRDPATGTAQPQRALFDQVTQVVQAVARERPLLLCFDDLHWADLGSAALLFHLGPQLAGCRILIVGAYRPEEVTLGWDGQRHPLPRVIHELARAGGAATVDLSQAAGKSFVDAYLDAEPNRLGTTFREALYRLSSGHPLFTVELVRSMQEQGGLVRDGAGYWREGQALDWRSLPSRIEAVIGERIERLTAELRTVLAVAAVQGVEFTAEVVADVLKGDVRTLVRQLSDELDRRHHLVAAHRIQWIGDRRLAHYRFRHILFQKYLFDHLDEVEQVQLHEEMGNALETIYGSQPEELTEIAGPLAYHYAEAGRLAKAIPYLCRAGNRALGMSAHAEAAVYFQRGLALLASLPDTDDRTRFELDLQLGLGVSLATLQGHGSAAAETAFLRAHQLCRQLGEAPQRSLVVWNLWRLFFVRGELRTAQVLAQEHLQMAERAQDVTFRVRAHEATGSTLFRLGEMAPARAHLVQARLLHGAWQHAGHADRYGQAVLVTCLSHEAQVLWYLGYPDQAQATGQAALEQAQRLGHAFSLAFALSFVAGLHQRMRNPDATLEFAARTLQVSTQHGFVQWTAIGTFLHGWALVAQGQIEEGIAQMRQGLSALSHARFRQLRYDALLAEAHARAGQMDRALAMYAETLQTAQKTGEQEWAAEMYRVRGELLQLRGEDQEAAIQFNHALGTARRQQAKSLELRAILSLSRLWQWQGKREAARQMLAELYGWFSEGLDTADLQEARALLEML